MARRFLRMWATHHVRISSKRTTDTTWPMPANAVTRALSVVGGATKVFPCGVVTWSSTPKRPLERARTGIATSVVEPARSRTTVDSFGNTSFVLTKRTLTDRSISASLRIWRRISPSFPGSVKEAFDGMVIFPKETQSHSRPQQYMLSAHRM